MSSPAAFLSYARQDDENSVGHLSELRSLLEREMQSITGDAKFRIFQDQEDVGWGQKWQNRIDESIDGSLILIPIISPFFFKRSACCDELERFLECESKLGRDDLILPIYFIEIPNFSSKNQNKLIAIISGRQYQDWRNFRHEDLKTFASKKRIAVLAKAMNATLHRTPTKTELELRQKRELRDRLEPILKKISGPFRNIPALLSLTGQLNSAGIDTLERLLIQSNEDLQKAGLDDQTIQVIVDDIAKFGHSLRDQHKSVNPIDELVLTPSCRAAMRNAKIQTVEDLASKSWNDLMLTGFFLPEHIEEASLRLQLELGRNIQQTDERQLTIHDIAARRVSG